MEAIASTRSAVREPGQASKTTLSRRDRSSRQLNHVVTPDKEGSNHASH